MSRDTMYGAVRKNLGETLFTGLYGLIGASLSVGAPLIGTINPPLAVVLAASPLLARYGQINRMVEYIQNEQLRQNMINYHKAEVTIKAFINIAMLAGTYYIGFALGPTACFLFVASFLCSKFINLGDASPIQHIEDAFLPTMDGINAPVYPENRETLWSSLGENANETVRATYYGLVATATQFPLPFIGHITEVTASLFFLGPLFGRITQTNQIQAAGTISANQAKRHRAIAIVSTSMDMLVGLGLFATAVTFQLDKIAVLIVLSGWIGAKLTSGGENSPLHKVQTFFNTACGAPEIRFDLDQVSRYLSAV